MNKNQRLVTYIIALVLFAGSFSPVFAQYGPYGGPDVSKSILLDKKVGKPFQSKGGSSIDYLDNLSSSDFRFDPGQEVLFKITVKNTSDAKLYGITVSEFVPSYLTKVLGPGSYSSENRTITINAGDFAKGEEKTYSFTFKIAGQEALPSDKGVICLVNKAQASGDSVFDEDTSQFCIEKQVVGVKEVPAAGPGLGLGLLVLQGLGVGTGIWLRKRN
ncbi:MAG: hypothetical protein WEC80_00980 [Patescibacteria group bacterium]